MSRHRDFDAAKAEIEGPPLTFVLGGHEFTCRAMIPAGPILALARNHGLTGLAALAELATFLYSVVVPEEEATLREVMDDVSFPVAVEICAWIIEESTGRPLSSAYDSQEKPSESGELTRVVSLTALETLTE